MADAATKKKSTGAGKKAGAAKPRKLRGLPAEAFKVDGKTRTLKTMPEFVLRAMKRREQKRKSIALRRRVIRKRSNVLRHEYINRAKMYEAKYERMKKAIISNHRMARKHDNFYVPPEPKLALVIRIRG